ncbi:DUF4065 domain-containing protein [Methanocalculus taiwanensis]|uniref:DUF4065 domain-containing protein n=1 Tax=Methanocalculus taiwanensis TaxID=106207 RepID=A0ABD4TGY2_9EURY|nr:Panacea domain-containing protein [Methanocalculus taiwanensis]MCQ1537761.1 DUF4065 domain-containing protein [Methanocalculus taiwanensis]
MRIKASLKDVIAYILKKYPDCNDLSDARLTKMIYLADWKKAVKSGDTVTDIKWYFDNYGPYVDDIIETANENPSLFTVRNTQNAFGGKKKEIKLNNLRYIANIPDEDAGIIDFVIEKTKDKTFSEFKKLIYNTYPIVFSNQYEYLDLIKLAEDYHRFLKGVKEAKNKIN